MAFFQQLRLLLWKNGLAVIRQPLWSLTLVIWPLVIFILIAVTRHQFPPVIRDTCYVGPRNLPSTGFFPFLQTLLCNTDSSCHNKSRLMDPGVSKASRSKRSTLLSEPSPLASLADGPEFFNFAFPSESRDDATELFKLLDNILGPSHQGHSSNVSFMSTISTALPQDQESMDKMLESVNLLKRAFCTVTLPIANTTSPNAFTYAVVTFCKSNDTVFEASLVTVNQILTELMLTKPEEMVSAAGLTVMFFNQLQNQTSLWDGLLTIPQLLSPQSFDQMLGSTKALLTNMQGVMQFIQSNFPETGDSLSTVHTLLAGSINMIHYVQNWPGRHVSISLGEVVTLPNISLSDIVKRVLQEVQIPLDKAIGLTLDKDMVRFYLCDNSSNPMWLTAACSTGTVDMLLSWISPDKVAQQALLAWSKHVAPHDVSFAKGLVEILMGELPSGGQGGSNFTRSRRSLETQPQNIEEELFLAVGQVVMDIIKVVPPVDMVFQRILTTAFQSMKTVTLGLGTVEEMMSNILKDADHLQLTYQMLLTNQSEASVWIGRVLDSVMEMIMKAMGSQSVTCEEFLRPIEWLLSTKSIKVDVWRSMICQNSSSVEEVLLMDWMPLIQKGNELYYTLTGEADYNVTLPMILSAWHKLYNGSLQFVVVLDELMKGLGGEYWTNWMPEDNADDVTGTLQQSVFLFVVNLGEKIEKTSLWPEVKSYFHMAYWILNFRPGVTTQPANCSVNPSSLEIDCDTGLKWPQFVQAVTGALMSPSQDVLLTCLKGTVNLLQHVYGNMYKHLAATYLTQEIKGGDSLSSYLINLLHNVDEFVETISTLPNQNISDPAVMLPLVSNMLQSTGLSPLLPLLLHDGRLNVSTILGVASKLGRLNQHIFTFNETDPTMPELERLIMQFFSLEGNLTMSLSHVMGNALLTYSDYFHPDDVARLREAIQPFTNQTSAGIVEAILSAVELLKTMIDSPNGDPTNLILGYLRQLQEFVISLYRLRKIDEVQLTSGQLTPAEVTDLHELTMDFLNLLTPESLQNLTQAGPDAAQDIVIQKFVAFLPPEIQNDAVLFLQDFKDLQGQITKCEAGENCLAGITELFTFLDQILEMMLSADVNVTISVAEINYVPGGREYEEIASMFFSLLLSPHDAAYVETFKQTLHFIRLVMASPNITVSSVEDALKESNLNIQQLNNITALAGAANINDLMANIIDILNVRQCFEPQNDGTVTTECVVGLINGVSRFLTHVPALRNDKVILSLLPSVLSKTVRDVVKINFGSSPNTVLAQTLNSTLANIKMGLRQEQLDTPEIMNEIKVMEGLIQLIGNMKPLSTLNDTLMTDPIHAQKVYLELVEWYLKRLENITRNSSASELLNHFYSITQMQVALQLAQTEFSLFASNKVNFLINNLKYPIDGAGVSEIGQTVIEILRQLLDFIKIQNNIQGPLFNSTILDAAEPYLKRIVEWMKQPNVPLLLSSMLQWGNSSMPASIPVTDLHQLLQSMVHFLQGDPLTYFSMVGNITESLRNVLMVAEQTGGLQSEHFSAAVLEAVQSAMQILTTATGPLPLPVQQNILEIVEDSLKLIVHGNMSFASSRATSLLILARAERVIKQVLPEMVAEYLLSGVEVITTYFTSISEGGGPENWNELILNEMKTIQSLLPPNNTAQDYVSVLINITHFILKSGQGNTSLWASFENASVENLPELMGQVSKLFSMFWRLVMGVTESQAMMVNFANEDPLAYLSIIGNITESLSKALTVAEQTGGLQSEHFSAAVLEAVQSAMQILTTATGPLPLPVQQDILEIVEDSLKLIVHGNMSFASSRATSLLILARAERVIQQVLPEMVAEYLLSGVEVITTYFTSISEGGGPENWNQLILNEMKTIQSLLPPNSTAQDYVSVLINITHFILKSGQGNASLWASFENASVENLPGLMGQVGKLFSMFWQLVGGTGSYGPLPPLEDFAHLVPVLESVMTGTANQDTWNKLEQMLETLLLTLRGTELWDSLPYVLPAFEKVTLTVVKETEAETAFIQSLQIPVVTLMRDIAQSVNTSQFNLTEVSERLQFSIEHTLQAAQEANGTLNCSVVLKGWDPVREAAGLSDATMAMWCSIKLQPVLDSFAASQNVYLHLNMNHTDMGSISANATAARIVKSVQSLYHVNINQSVVIDQFIYTFSSQLDVLAGRPLSPEAQHYWYWQLQDMQLQSSLSSIKMLSDELLDVAPFLEPYMDPIVKSLSHVLENYQLIQDGSSSQELLSEAVMIFLTAANITSPDGSSSMWGILSGPSLTDMMKEIVKLMIDMNLFGDSPAVYQALEHILVSNDTSMIVEKVAEFLTWLTSTQATGLDLLSQAMTKMYHIIRPLVRVFTSMNVGLPVDVGLFEDLAGNIIAMFRQVVTTGGLLVPIEEYHISNMSDTMEGHKEVKSRQRRDAPMMMMARDPMDDFIDLLYIDYPAMFRAIAVPPTATEIMETVHVLIANPDLGVVIKGATNNMPWGLNASREDTIDAALGVVSSFTVPGVFDAPSLDILKNAVEMIPDGFPFASVIKSIARALASEPQENLILMQQTIQTAAQLFQTSLTEPQFMEQLRHLTSQVCALENTESLRLLMQTLSVEPGVLCQTILPSLEMMVESLLVNATSMSEVLFQTFIGDPMSYSVQTNWSSVLSEVLGFNTSSLRSLNINATSPGVVTIGEMLRNKTAFVLDVQRYDLLHPATLHVLMETILPNNNFEIMSWLINLRDCGSAAFVNMTEADAAILKTFCSMPLEQWYTLSVLMARHLNTEKVIYRVVLSEDIQSLVGAMLQMAEVLADMMDKFLPAIDQVQSYLLSVKDLNLVANNEFSQLTRGQRSTISTRATFVTLSRALCSNGILALFGISNLPSMSESKPSVTNYEKREEMIERFKIPRNATPFCTDMYLDMVNTTGGAIAWAFLKPMLMGQILYTPDTPTTRAIMEKANATLQKFANLSKYSEDWIESSKYIINSAEVLRLTLPMLQNSLSNSFVKNFIEMQTDIDVDRMKETLSNFSDMTVMLEKNKHILNQITSLSTLMVELSSCITFDRYRGYDSAVQLNADAHKLAKNRDLYASVIFKLPKDADSPSSSASSLPPKVSYTIRMHMDNMMRTDRVRDPYFVKDPHISDRQTMRYNRGFIYLQENIDRAIIETQTGKTINETAVQLQPFPYPCHLRDEYLEALFFVFPLMLMIAWVLFVADFVKKLVHERELRLHEYMKMMGVNPLSHFFAWFLECASYLVVTIIIITLVLKCGKILPHSDGFLIFLYLCDYGLSILAFSYLVSSFFDKTYIAGLSGSLLYILFFFPFIVVLALESNLTFSQKSALSLFSPTCFSYASQYVSRYESQGEGIQWSNSYSSPIAGDTASFGWLCWLMLIDSILYFIIGGYIRMVFPGKYGISSPWYFPFKLSFWADLCGCVRPKTNSSKGLLFTNIMHDNQPVFSDDKGKGQSKLSSNDGGDFSELPVGVALHGLSKIYGDQAAIENLNVTFYEGHVTSLLGHNGAGKTTTMSLLTGLFAPSSGTIEVYGKDMQANIDSVRKELGVCMQYDVLFDHMTTKEHLLLYGQIKAPHWSQEQLHEQVRTILQETDMYSHRHKRVGTLSGGMKRKLSISIAFIGGSRLVVLDEPTTGVDPCSRRSIWDIVIQHKKHRTIVMSTHHLDEAEVLSDRIAFLERGGIKCCGSPFHLKDKLGQGYKLTLTKKMQDAESERVDDSELKGFIQAHVPEARLKEAHGGDLVYSLPPFNSNPSSYRSLLTALDANLDDLQLGGYGISDTTLEEVFLQLTHGNAESEHEPLSVSETVSDSDSIDSFPSDSGESFSSYGDKIKFASPSTVSGMALAWQQMAAILTKRFNHSRRDWKGLISQILLPVLFVVFAMGLGCIKSDLQHYQELELSPALYNIGPSYSFFSNQNPNSRQLVDTMMSFPGIDNACLEKSDNMACTRSTNNWSTRGNSSKPFSVCKCTRREQICEKDNYQPPHKKAPSSQVVYNLSGINVENYLVTTANDFIRNRYGGFSFGMPLPADLQMDITAVPQNRTLSKVWFNPEGHHTMPAYLNSLNNLILRSNLPADKDPRKYAISVSSHPYFGRVDDEDAIVEGLLQILVAMCVLTGYSITTASFAIYEVNEHRSGSKRLQHIAGISEPFYWTVNFIYDMAIYMIPVTLTIGVIAAFQIPAFTDRQNLAAVALLLVLFGFATFPWMYLLSGVIGDAEMAFITYVCINLFISINTILSTSILHFMSQISMHNTEVIQDIFNRLSCAFLVFPQFNFGNGLMKLARMNIEVQVLSGYGVDAYKDPFSAEVLGWMFISSLIQGLVFFTLRLLLNKSVMRKVRSLICRRKTVPQVSSDDEDEDVAAEHQRVSSGAANSDILQVNQLSKVYQKLKNKVHAVKRLSVGIPAGECFGLLGVNGAGKTTTFKMLTGDVSPTDGTAQIRDIDGRLVDIMECRNQGINIGYCPQEDALDGMLTGEEHLYFYARIRGISKKQIDGVVNYLLKRLELNRHRDIITDSYSCGTRRKLSTALALIGHPQILLLDEPSSGMDPRTKRHLWKIISEEVKGKSAVVLTSHSMEECEALCSRLAIMVKGQFRCLGSLQHIKNRFGSGFTVKMYLAEASCDAEAITSFMQRRFPSTYLKDQHSTMVEYHIPVAPGGVADIFNQLESNKNALRIKHFSVSQTTLDEVFINFAMGNIGMETEPIPSEDDRDVLDSIKAEQT